MELQSFCRQRRFDKWFEKTFHCNGTTRYFTAKNTLFHSYLGQHLKKIAWMRDRIESSDNNEFELFNYWHRRVFGTKSSNDSDDEEEDHDFSDEDKDDDTSRLETVLRETTVAAEEW